MSERLWIDVDARDWPDTDLTMRGFEAHTDAEVLAEMGLKQVVRWAYQEAHSRLMAGDERYAGALFDLGIAGDHLPNEQTRKV